LSKNIYEIEIYDFEILGLLKEAYRRSDGVKAIFLTAIFTYIVIAVVLSGIFNLLLGGVVSEQINSLLSTPVLVPIMTGITMLAIKYVRGEELVLASIFDYFIKVWPLVFASIATYAMMAVGFLLLVLPGIYLAVSYKFTLALIADKDLGIWEAMELSRKTVTKRWFKFFGLDIAILIMMIISFLAFGIGLIWTIPIAFISQALLYHHLFDDEKSEEIIQSETDI
jgi:uncharacterized membrane protein